MSSSPGDRPAAVNNAAAYTNALAATLNFFLPRLSGQDSVRAKLLQQAALGKASGKITEWLKAQSLDQNPRVAQQLRVEPGWERAVETVLGAYLEAVCVDGVDAVADLLGGFDGGHLVVVSG